MISNHNQRLYDAMKAYVDNSAHLIAKSGSSRQAQKRSAVTELGCVTKEEEQMGYGEQSDATARFAINEKGRALKLQTG